MPRYTDKPQGYSPQKPEDWRSRFPSHARSMDSAPMGSRPIRVYEPSGKSYLALHHLNGWRQVSTTRDPYTGTYSTRMNGEIVGNPVAWTSS